jgi:hypothetical protein
MLEPSIHKLLGPRRHRNCSQPSSFADQIYDDPPAFPGLQLIQGQSHDFRTSQATPQKQPENRAIPPTAQVCLRRGVHQLLCLVAGEPVATSSPEPLHALNSPDSDRQFRRQPAALRGLIGEPADRRQMQVDRSG